MFKCFGSAKRPNDDKDPKDWDTFFAESSTEDYLKCASDGQAGSSNQRGDPQDPAPSAQSHTNSTAHLSDHNGNQAHSPPTPGNDKHSSLSSKFGSNFGSAESDKSATVAAPPSHHHHHGDELQQLKDAEAKSAAATVPPAAHHHHHTTATFGVLQQPAPSPARQVPAASPSVSTDSGTFHDDDAASPPASGSFASAAASVASAPLSAFGTLPAELGGGGRPAARAPLPASAFTTAGDGGFHGFGPTTVTPSGAKSSAGAAAARMFQSAMGAARNSTSPPDSSATRPLASDLKTTPPSSKSTVAATPSTTPSGGGGGAFACFRNGRSAPNGRPTVSSPSSFDGFGSGRSTANSADFGFGSGRAAVNAAAFNTNASPFTPSSSSPASTTGPALNAFGRPMAGGPTAPSAKDTVSFGTLQDTVVPAGPSAPSAPGASSASAAGAGMVRMNFGTLHVSGPAATMRALAEREKREQEMAHQQQEQEQEAKRRVRFEDEKRGEEKKEVKKDVQKSAESDDDTENEAEVARELPRPWGKRPCFRGMLEGGNKKLVLTNPPKGVVDYFSDHVDRSYGCCYDNISNTFYATSPGDRGRNNGRVVALNGNCTTPAFTVANSLSEPAAIAVYEPGLSVCVVTNKGIFVLTRRDNMQGEMDSFLCRQISHRGFHRGIATTANGGIVSCNNGRIRMFDGGVANGEEKVLAEANYDTVINNTLFADLPNRRNEKPSPCFMDIVDNRLVMSDLQKHVISLWEIVESPGSEQAAIKFVRAIDVATSANPTRGRQGVNAAPLGKCAYAAGIRLDAEGWVMCADAEGRTIQIWDNELKFVTRLEAPARLPYISGLYIEKGGHLMVCDRRTEMGGLRVYMLETQAAASGEEKENKQEQPAKSFSFAAAARLQGGRF